MKLPEKLRELTASLPAFSKTRKPWSLKLPLKVMELGDWTYMIPWTVELPLKEGLVLGGMQMFFWVFEWDE